MNNSNVAEILTSLYLRLNGYFTTGLIIHSDIWGQTATDFDCIALRHPFHVQNERSISSSGFMQVSDSNIDLIFCEVKSDIAKLRFNNSIVASTSPLQAALKWTGLFKESQIPEISDEILPYFSNNCSSDNASQGIVKYGIRIRAMLCCPTGINDNTSIWCLDSNEVFSFIDECLNPPERRECCSTRYNFQIWGYPYTPIISYFKNCQKTYGHKPNPGTLMAHLQAN